MRCFMNIEATKDIIRASWLHHQCLCKPPTNTCSSHCVETHMSTRPLVAKCGIMKLQKAGSRSPNAMSNRQALCGKGMRDSGSIRRTYRAWSYTSLSSSSSYVCSKPFRSFCLCFDCAPRRRVIALRRTAMMKPRRSKCVGHWRHRPNSTTDFT